MRPLTIDGYAGAFFRINLLSFSTDCIYYLCVCLLSGSEQTIDQR